MNAIYNWRDPFPNHKDQLQTSCFIELGGSRWSPESSEHPGSFDDTLNEKKGDPTRQCPPNTTEKETGQDDSDVCSLNCGEAQKDVQYLRALLTFLLVSIVSALLIIGLEGFMLGALTAHRLQFYSLQRYFEMTIFLSLFIFAAIYQCIITIVGLETKNMLLISMLCIFYGCMLVYTGVQYREISNNVDMISNHGWNEAIIATNVATIVVIAVTLFSQTMLIYFVLWRGVQWFRFKKIGASLEIKRLYSYFQIHRSLLVFDLFFFLGFTVQFIVIMVSDRKSAEFILTCTILPLTVIVLFASDFAATREWVWLTVLTMICFISGMCYVLFKIIRLYTKYTSAYNVALAPGAYFPGRSSLISFGVITLLFLISTIILEGVMMHEYHRGLLPYLCNYFTTNRKKNEGIVTVGDDTESMIID